VLLLAIPSAGSALISELAQTGVDAGLDVKTVPSIGQLFGAHAQITDIREVTEEDLLGRHSVDIDVDSIAGYITDKRVLVSGAGGSIGSELCRQLYRFAPAELIMLDRDESALHAVELSIQGRALLDGDALALLDIRDRIGLDRLFQARRPDVVFHAAALKHLPLLERHPAEAIKTNVWGTLALLETSVNTGVERFVNISTDKAAEPISVLGYSKRICERLTAHFAVETGLPYLSVRFGNVVGTRGSVLGTFRGQIANGGPLTVTDPDVTRYFMTVEEAVQLVVQAGAIGRPGDVLVLDMGDPVKILRVARLLAARAPRPVEIVFTGLRAGEKLEEDLFGEGEKDDRPLHPLISHVTVPPLAPDRVQTLDPTEPDADSVLLLRSLSKESAALRRHARAPLTRGFGTGVQ
jgi:FlaA1/EpsC-like NDP-sugar epimerase